MKKVNGAILALLLLQSGCSGGTVPTADEIQAAFDKSDLIKAREMARSALNANPADPRVILLNSQIAIESGSPDYAINALRPLLDDQVYGKRARGWLGRALVMSNQPGEAIRLLGDRAPIDGLSAAVAVVAYRAVGELDRAREAFATGKAAFPNAPELLMIEAEESLRVGDMGRARNRIQSLIQFAPRKIDTQMLAMRMDMIDGRVDQAEKRLSWILTVRPDHAAALLAMGSLRKDKGDLAGAETYLKKAAKLNGSSAIVAQYLRARIAYDKGDKAKANELMADVPNAAAFPPAAQLAGILAAEAGQNDRAVRMLQGYLAGNPDDAQARTALARALMQSGDNIEAWHYLEPVARGQNASAASLALAAQVTQKLGLPGADVFQARQQRAAASDARLALFAQGQQAMQAKNWKRADQIYAELLRGAPPAGDRILLNNAAVIRQQLGDLESAEKLVRRALSLGIPDAVVLDTASWILFQKYGATPEVKAWSAKAVALKGDDPEIKAHAARIRAAGN